MSEEQTTETEVETPAEENPQDAKSNETSGEQKADEKADEKSDEKADEKVEEESPKDDESKVPEKYDFGDEIDPDSPLAKTMSEVFKEVGLDNDSAKKLAVKYHEFALAQVDQWLEETKVDEEIGGDALDANVAIASKALEAYGTPELREFLDASGLGNHKEVIRFFYKVGQTLTEDNPGRGAPAAEPRDRVSILYKS